MNRSTHLKAALAAAALLSLSRSQGEPLMGQTHTSRLAAPAFDPKPPVNEPPGDLTDAVGDHDESEFNEDEDSDMDDDDD